MEVGPTDPAEMSNDPSRIVLENTEACGFVPGTDILTQPLPASGTSRLHDIVSVWWCGGHIHLHFHVRFIRRKDGLKPDLGTLTSSRFSVRVNHDRGWLGHESTSVHLSCELSSKTHLPPPPRCQTSMIDSHFTIADPVGPATRKRLDLEPKGGAAAKATENDSQVAWTDVPSDSIG